MGLFIFFDNFLYFLCLQFWDSRYRKKKNRDLLIGQPQGSLSESRLFVVFNLKFTFSCGLST